MHVPAHRLQTAKSDHSQRETEFLKQRAKCVDVHHAVEAAALTRVGCFLLLMAYASTDRLFFFSLLQAFVFLLIQPVSLLMIQDDLRSGWRAEVQQ